MENNEYNFESPGNENPHYNPGQSFTELKLGPISIEHLREVAKWAKFLSIVAMVGLILYFVLVVIFLLYFIGNSSTSAEQINAFASIPILLMVLIFIGIYFTPILWLYKFSTNLQSAISVRNSEQLTVAFNYLRKHYKFIGIIAIIGIAFYALSIIGVISTGVISTLVGAGGL